MTWMDRGPFTHVPGIPEPSAVEMADTLLKLNHRQTEDLPAKQALTDNYRIGGAVWSGYDWLFGDGSEAPLALSLDSPDQFSIGWTNYDGIRSIARAHKDAYAATLTDIDSANEAFWPTIAAQGYAYNLLLLRKVTDERFDYYATQFGQPTITARYKKVQDEGRLFEIDLGWLETLAPARNTPGGHPRFNPGTQTLLVQSKTEPWVFTPSWIRVSSNHPTPRVSNYGQIYPDQTPSSWLYALQAVKASVTVWGIWIGHVYHWHLVNAAMQGSMYDAIGDTDHPIRRLMDPQSEFLIPFDFVLFNGAVVAPNLFSEIAPPTSVNTPTAVLAVADAYAVGRDFFDDDPRRELAAHGLLEKDFTKDQPWDMFPVAQKLLQVYTICENFVREVVAHSWDDDDAVAADQAVQDWRAMCVRTDRGNVTSLPELTSRAVLAEVLTSLVYRSTIHGYARLIWVANPALTFVSNFPPCLQTLEIPDRSQVVSEDKLLTALPNTTTIGEMIAFYFAFSFSAPYVTMVPIDEDTGKPDPSADLYFDGGVDDHRNQALVSYRNALDTFMGDVDINIAQWPRNIET